jgi:hypothetical protein
MFTSIAELNCPKTRRLYDYWDRLRGDRVAPSRRDIDPAALHDLLPNLMIVDIERHPFRVRYRLVGTEIVAVTGFEFTGRYLDEIALPEDDADFAAFYHKAATDRAPVFGRPIWHAKQWVALQYDIAVFPLSDDGETINKAFAAEFYDAAKRHPAFRQALLR